MFGHKRKDKKPEEPSLWKTPPLEQNSEIVATTETLEPPATEASKEEKKRRLQRLHFHLPRPRYMRRVAKAKRVIAFGFGLIYLLSGAFTLPSPLAAVGFVSAWFMFEYVWMTRKLSWLAEGRGL